MDNSSIIVALINQSAVWLPVITMVGSAIGGAIVWLYRTKVKRELAVEDVAILEGLCRNAVAWVEQTVKKAKTETTEDYAARRLQVAAEFVAERAQALGVSATSRQVLVFVEAAVLGLANPMEPKAE